MDSKARGLGSYGARRQTLDLRTHADRRSRELVHPLQLLCFVIQ